MTVDGSEDERICIQGVDTYSFCDSDGGDLGCESDACEEEASEETHYQPVPRRDDVRICSADGATDGAA
eukprot:5059473-Prymnesium_polylepis.1